MSATGRGGGYRRAELYLRTDTYGTYDAQQRAIDRLRTLEDEGVLAAGRVERWAGIEINEYEGRESALATYDEFQDWARRNDADLEPAFQRRPRRTLGRRGVTEVVVFPVIALAIYSGEDLRAVFPSRAGDRHYTVEECLDALEVGTTNRLLGRFRGRPVERTGPLMEAAIG